MDSLRPAVSHGRRHTVSVNAPTIDFVQLNPSAQSQALNPITLSIPQLVLPASEHGASGSRVVLLGQQQAQLPGVNINVPAPPQPPKLPQPLYGGGVLPEAPPRLIPAGERFVLPSGAPPDADRHSPCEPLIGDVKATLDDLKASVVSYYSNLYKEGGSIADRLERLSQHFYASPFPLNGNEPAVTAYGSLKHPEIGLNNPASRYIPLNEAADGHRRPQEYEQAPLDQVPPPDRPPGPRDPFLRNASLSHTENFFGMMSKPGEGKPDADRDIPVRNIMGMDMDDVGQKRRKDEEHGTHVRSPAGSIEGVLSELKSNVKSCNTRLRDVAGVINAETENPNLDTFAFRTYPRLRKRATFHHEEGIDQHVLQLYSDLYNATMYNQRRIKALQAKIRVLDMHNKKGMMRIKDDPRIGF